MKISILFASLILLSTQSKADDQFAKLYSFAEDIRDPLLQMEDGHPIPNQKFQLTTLEADQVKALAGLDNLMRERLEIIKSIIDCDKKTNGATDGEKEFKKLESRVKNRQFQLDAVVITNNKKFEQESLGRFMSDGYMTYMSQLYWQESNSKAADIYTVSSLTEKYKLSHPENNFDKLGISERETLLNGFAESYLGVKLPAGLLMKEMTFQEMVNNSKDWKKTITEAKDKLSSQQIIELVSKIDGSFSRNYNYARLNAGKDAYGSFVTTQQLLDSVKDSTPGGICRDDALAAAQILEAAGFKNNYVVGYKDLTGYHAITMSTDPVTKKTVKFNYDDVSQMSNKNAGTESLTQDSAMPSHGIVYRVYDTNGKPVVKVQSELAQMLKSATGGEDREFNQQNYSISKVAFSNPYVNGSLFTGKTSLGETLYGVALYKDIAVSDNFKIEAAAAVSKLSGDRSVVHIDQTDLYLRLKAEVTSPTINLGAVKASAFAGIEGQGQISNAREKSLATNSVTEAKRQLDGDLDMYVGVQGKATSADQKTSVDAKMYVNFYPDWNHVASGGNYVATLNSAVIQTGITREVTEETKVKLYTAAAIRQYGTSAIGKILLEDEKHGMIYTAEATTPITKDMPAFLPGAERSIAASVAKKMKSDKGDYVFLIEVKRNLDTNTNTIGIKGKGEF